MSFLNTALKIKYCEPAADNELLAHFKNITDPLPIHNIFNPSFYCDRSVKIFTFRAIPNGNDLLASFVSIEDTRGRLIKNISIDLYHQLHGVRLIDPKITRINGEFYITFNSGCGYLDEENDIFIMKIYPEMGPPKKVIYKNRTSRERNWAFFSENGEIYALYSINPLKILKVKKIMNFSWELEDFYHEDAPDNATPKDLSIGTQLFPLNDHYCFVAHRKIRIYRKRIYIGKFCRLDFTNKKVSTGKHWLVHSFKSLWGARQKHNKNLFSCTYFSGLQALNDTVNLGYGINDVSCNFSSYNINDL